MTPHPPRCQLCDERYDYYGGIAICPYCDLLSAQELRRGRRRRRSNASPYTDACSLPQVRRRLCDRADHDTPGGAS